MKERTGCRTISYEDRDGFLIDIEIDTAADLYRAFLSHKDYVDKMYMFGAPMPQQPYGQFLDIVEGNIDEYIPDYIEQYFDEEDTLP